MAHFRAVIQGQRGEASRLGSKKTGMTIVAQTWGFDLRLDMSHCSNERAAEDRTLGAGDWASVELVRHGERMGKLVARINLTTGEII